MTKLFMTVLRMSITASFVILAVLLLRVILKRAPRIYSYLLWLVVMVRLVCPYAVGTSFGIIPEVAGENKSEAGQEMLLQETESLDTASEKMASQHHILSGSLSGEATTSGEILSSTRSQPVIGQQIGNTTWHIIVGIWLTGCVMLIIYGFCGYLKLLQKLARLREEQTIIDGYDDERIIFSDKIETPFTAGFLNPGIYLPDTLSIQEAEMIIEHERVHIRRRDYLIKAIAYAITCIHWFNPLVWLFFYLFEADMETSCDEAVLKRIGYDRKKAYAKTLLSMSGGAAMEFGRCPLSFGENHVKSRIKNAVKLKKAKTWIAAASGVLVFLAAILLSVNHKAQETEKEAEPIESASQKIQDAQKEHYETEEIGGDGQIADEIEENDETEYQGIQIDTLTYGEVYAEENDSYAVLLKNPLGNFTDEGILYSYPVYGTVGAASYGEQGEVVITSVYGKREHPILGTTIMHSGIDFGAVTGTSVHAAADGTVLETGTDTQCGKYVILIHINGDLTYYSNCEEILVQEGQNAIRGQEIATVGNSGMSTGSHLHFALSRAGAYVEPEFISME